MTRSIALLMLTAALAMSGCSSSSMGRNECSHGGQCQNGYCHDDCVREDDFCPDAVPAKPGTYVNGWTNAMRCAARENEFVIHRNSWFNGGTEIGPEATEELHELAGRLISGPDHVLVEKEPVQPDYSETLAEATARTDHLNSTRRENVVAALAKAGVTDADARVHLGPHDALGTRGIEAPRVFNQLFIGGNRGGQNGGRGGGAQGGGGFGGGGGGGRGF